MHEHRRHLMVVCLSVVTGLAAGTARCEPGLVNPYFTEWQSARPVGWQVLGNPSVWSTDSLAGATCTPSLGLSEPGSGLAQHVAVQPDSRYYINVLTGATPARPAEIVIQDTATGAVLFRSEANRAWPQEHAGFFTTTGAEIEFRCSSSTGGGSLQIDNVILHRLVPDLTPSLVPVPPVPVFYASVDTAWTSALTAVNIVNDPPADPALREELRKRGILCLKRAVVPNRKREINNDLDAQVDELVAHWMRVFVDTHAGTVPTAADGIIVDELDAFDDDDPELAKWEKALAELRRLFPNKIIAVWGSNGIAAPTPDGQPRARIMRMLERYTDLFMIEIYQADCPRNPGPDWVDGARGYGRNLSEYREAAQNIFETCPDLLPKTVVCLVTAQNVGMNFDISATHDFLDWLRVQVTNIPRYGRDGAAGFAGIGQWVSYRARRSTLIAFEQYVREVFLAARPPVPLTEKDARHPIRDPNFEASETGAWVFGGNAGFQDYAETEVPPLHDGKVEHFARFARVAAPGTVRQTIRLAPGSWHQVSVYAAPLTAAATAVVRVLDGDRVIADTSADFPQPSKWWLRVPLTFRVPGDATAICIEFSARGAGAEMAFDCADLAPAEGLNRPPSIAALPRVRLRDLPKTVTLRGRNLLPKDIVRIGTDIYPQVEYVSDRKLRVRIPALPAAGDYDVTLRHQDWLGEAQSATVQDGLRVRP